MKKKKILSLILCLSLFCSLIVPASSAYADQPGDSGMRVSKAATANQDGTYTITLEAYATGSQVTSTITEDVPTDIILVLDQSGSMEDDIGQVQYTAYTGNNTQNKSNYEKRHNGGSANLWHKLSDDSFVSDSVTLQQTITYNKITKGRNDSSRDGYTNYWENRNNLYTYVNGEIRKVVYTRERDNVFQNWNCKYALEDGTILNQNNEGSRYSPTFQNTDDSYLYLAVANENQNVYTYTYTDSNGTTQTIGTSTGANMKYTPAFYQRSTTTSGGGSRLNALKSAANTFIGTVAEKAVGNPAEGISSINHRIAVVGFASESENGNNTELLSIAGNNSGSVGVAYNSITNQNLKDVLQSMDTQNGRAMVNAAINALAANGATRTDLGMDMAQRILNANPVPAGETRNRVVIVFTDGSPTNNNGFERSIANSAITTSNAIKAGGTTVYSIGIFSGADASTAGKEPDNDYYDYGFWQDYTEAEMSAACNWFMQKVSSNNGTPRTPSYYLSAGDSASLNNIFQQISDQIETGGSETTLGSETVIKDIISPYFTLPAGASASDIRLDTYDCTGMTGDTYAWSSTSGGSDGASAAVTGDQVSVTGFDFSENWCGTETGTDGSVTYRGKKLVITFTVDPKPGFLGGNGVPTNDNAGVYENGSATTPVITFEQPTVDVPIQDVTVTAEDKNVYLLGGVTADDLKNGATVEVGGVELNLNAENYGLQDWQTAFVAITVAVKDKDGNIVSDKIDKLINDTTYTIEVTVAPKNEGNATEKTGSKEGKINVFKPELTFKDSEGYYGADVPELSGNLTKTEWKHGTTLDTAVTMIGAKPELGFTYTPEAGKIDNNKINTKQDIGVDVAVKIGNADVTNHTTFLHTACAGQTCTLPEGKEFLIHVKTCTLTITKSGGADNESYVFDVLKDGKKYSEVTIWGNGTEELVELPVGTYTIQENTDWSWRYSANNGGSAELTAQNPNGSITCTNTANGKNYWLNGFSQVVRNIIGASH